jgi:Tfp pilus assembly protein PilN
MIQLNLLPDVKLDYIKAERMRRMALSIAVVASLVAVGLLVLLLLVSGLQKKHISDLSKDITRDSHTLQQKPQINKILTVQNQLESLTALHSSKPAVSRLFDYLYQVTPSSISITSINTDFTTQTMTITGTADALNTVNKYIDTLKYTTFKTDDSSSTGTKAFSNIVLSSFSINATGKDNSAATYSITMAYDKTIFDITQKVTLVVPNKTTTRASLEQPEELFKATVPAASTAPAPATATTPKASN